MLEKFTRRAEKQIQDSREKRSSEFGERATEVIHWRTGRNENGTKVNGASETCGTTDQHNAMEEEKGKVRKIFEKIMSENSANLIENINLHMHVAQQTQLG